MATKPLYIPLSPEHAALLVNRRLTFGELLSRIDQSAVSLHAPIEWAQFILDNASITRKDIQEQEAIGVLIGDEIVRLARFEWVSVDDEYGSEPVVAHPTKMAVIAPLSAVTARFEDGEIPFDLNGFIEEALAILHEVETRNRGIHG